MQKVISFTIDDKVYYKQALEIREKVFIHEQHVARDLEVENEEDARYYLVTENGKPVGTGRWRETSEGVKLERFAILPEYRNRQLGTFILKKVLDDLKNCEKKIYLHSQIRAVPYYQRQGFVKVGEMFVEAGIRHYTMILKT